MTDIHNKTVFVVTVETRSWDGIDTDIMGVFSNEIDADQWIDDKTAKNGFNGRSFHVIELELDELVGQ